MFRVIYAIFCFVFVHSCLFAKNIDVISNYDTCKADQQGYPNCKMRFFRKDVKSYSKYDYKESIDFVVINNIIFSPSDLCRIPYEKRILFLREGNYNPAEFAEYFSKIFTHHDDFADNIKIFKYCLPKLEPMLDEIPEFHSKKLCCILTGYWTKERTKITRNFTRLSHADFDIYSRCHGPFYAYPNYKGKLPGRCVGSKLKHKNLSKYRFSICFENKFLPGYISEKIFDSMAAGCVPVYFGAPNIEDYIPNNCFIDYRDFSSDEELFMFIKQMDEYTYQQYIDNIQQFLVSEKAQLFSRKTFKKLISDL